MLDGLRSLRPEVPVVALGTDAQLAVEARRHGVRAFVCTPSDEDLDGVDRDTHLEVFSLRLEKAMQKAMQKATAAAGPEAPGGA